MRRVDRAQRTGLGRRAPAGFTLIELLVVIAVITVLIALLVPSLRAARDQAHRAVCLSHLKQLTTAWMTYADANNGRLVSGKAFYRAVHVHNNGTPIRLNGWMGRAFLCPKSREALVADPNKGPLWPYLQDVDIYRCPAGLSGHLATYQIFSSVNGYAAPGTITDRNPEIASIGVRVGRTVLHLSQIAEITDPGPALRAVFIDAGQISSGYEVPYLVPNWHWASPPPVHHGDGATLSFADGHAEYWKWAKETINIPRSPFPLRNDLFGEVLADSAGNFGDYTPRTEEGVRDLQRLQRASYGRIGYRVRSR
jgi:prepilin-type N-terminal cleavage/methylation domain-containing protein/prepilin-type processing-associated H-X9-DG protein